MQKQILVSGATGNLGKEVCKVLVAAGHHLHINYRSQQHFTSASEANISAYQADLAVEEQAGAFARAAISNAGRIDAGVFLAGGFTAGKIGATSSEEIQKMISLNFLTTFHLVKPLKAHFEANGGGQFIFTGARPALVPEQGKTSFAYTLSKSLLFQLAEMINADGKDKKISATVVVPSIIDTPDNREAMPKADFATWIPPVDIAESILFMLGKTGGKMRETILKLYNEA